MPEGRGGGGGVISLDSFALLVLLCNKSVLAVPLDDDPIVSTVFGEWAEAADTLDPSATPGAAGTPPSGELADSELKSLASAAIVHVRARAHLQGITK